MKFSYRLARLCGSVHDRANVVFAPAPLSNGGGDAEDVSGQGEELLFSAVGNRINVFELTKVRDFLLSRPHESSPVVLPSCAYPARQPNSPPSPTVIITPAHLIYATGGVSVRH